MRPLSPAHLLRPAVLLLVVWGTFAASLAAPPAYRVREAGDVETVDRVVLGSHAWRTGVRPGQQVAGVAEGVADIEIDGLLITVSPTVPPNEEVPPVLLLAALLAAAGIAMGLPGAALAGVGLAGLVAAAGVGILGWPSGELVWLAPLGLSVVLSSLPRRTRLWVAGLAGLALSVCWRTAAPVDPTSWTVLALAGPLAALILPALEGGRRLLRARCARDLPFGAALAAELLPGGGLVRRAARDEERRELALRLHNDVLPALAASTATVEARAGEEAARELRAVSGELRELMSERETVLLDRWGIDGAVRSVAEGVEARWGLTVALDLADSGGRPRVVDAAAYRIAQEALTNAAHHAGADRLEVTLRADARALDLRIVDDGVGIGAGDEDLARARGHVGIACMRAHARDVGGQVTIEPRAGGGTEVSFRWPV